MVDNIGNNEILIENIQPWVNRAKIAADSRIISEFAAKEKQGINSAQYLHEILGFIHNDRYKTLFQEAINESDEKNIEFHPFSSLEISEIAGTPIVQPMFLISNDDLYNKIDRIFFPPGSENAPTENHGFWTDMSLSSHPDWQKSALLIAKKSDITTQLHEARHGIDPFTGTIKRHNIDRSVGEMFAHYSEDILHGLHGEKNWDHYYSHIVQPGYYKAYTGITVNKNPIQSGSWKQLVSDGIATLNSYSKKYGHLETQRKLVQCRTLNEVLNLK
jgi:hypothetical protein